MKPIKRHMAASINKVIFIVMAELMANSYLNTKIVEGFDPATLNKLRNLKHPLEAGLKKDVAFLENGGKDVFELYHEITNVFEKILVTAKKGEAGRFEGLIKIMDEYLFGDLQVFETIEEAIPRGKQKEMFVDFFMFFRENGEGLIGLSIEQFVEEYLKQTA